jgi:CRISPR/Cas system endoribonuclease Cas6 (RAMP superfamily)
MGMLLFSKLRTISAISFMLTISSLPIFTGSRKSDLVNLKGKVDNEHNAEFYQEIRTNLKQIYRKLTPNLVFFVYNHIGRS